MRLYPIAAAALLTAAATSAAPRADANAAFEQLGRAYIDALTAEDPVSGTQLGDHRHDAELPRIDATGRAARAESDRQLLTRLRAVDRHRLTRDNQVDYALLDNALRYDLWDLSTLQTWAWNPQFYHAAVSNALYALVARDFAPFPQRLAAITARMEAIPAFLAETRRQLDPTRVPRIHAETVAKQNAGIMEIVDQAIVPEVTKSGLDHTRFDAARTRLKAALTEQQTWLDTVLVPNARGDFRLGPKLYDEEMKFALMSPLSRVELKAKAQAAFADTRAQMERLARTFPD